MSLTHFMRSLQKRDVTFTVTWKLKSVQRDGNQLLVTIDSDYGGLTRTRSVDQLVVNHGMCPLGDVYFELKPGSSNFGAVDYEALVTGAPQSVNPNPEGTYRLFRIGPQHPRSDL